MNFTPSEKENIKNVLYFINAHRDGCCGDFVKDHFKINDKKLIDMFKQMYEEKLIDFENIFDNAPTEYDFLNAMVFISGGYTHPDYKDIY